MATMTEVLLELTQRSIVAQAKAYGPGTIARVSPDGHVSYLVPDRPRAAVQEIRRPAFGRSHDGGYAFRRRSWGTERPVTEKAGSTVSATRRAEVTRAINYVMGPARSPLVRWFYPSTRSPELLGLSSRSDWEIWLRDGVEDSDGMVAVTAVHELWHLANPDAHGEAAEREATALGLAYWKQRIAEGGI